MAVPADSTSQLSTERWVPQSSTLVRLWYAVSKTLSSLVPLSDGGDALFVAEHPQDGIVGFIQAVPAPGKQKALQIVNLCTVSNPSGQVAADELLVGLTNHGQELGVQRFYVRLPLDHPLLSGFVEQGFTQYATEQILYAEREAVAAEEPSLGLRVARPDDAAAIHLLYLRVTPATVAAIEAPSRKAWESVFASGAVSHLGKDDVIQLVAENPGIYGWAAITPATATRPVGIWLMCEAHREAERETFLNAVLTQLPAGPVACVLRHYESELIRSLQQRGFAVYGTQVLLAKDLGVKVRIHAVSTSRRKKPVLAVGVAHSTPVAAPVALRVLRVVQKSGGTQGSPSR